MTQPRPDTGTDKLLVEVDDGVAIVTFNNPAKHNALSSDIRTALPGAAGRPAGRPGRPRGRADRGRGPGVRVGRRHLRVRRAAHLARGPGRVRPGRGRIGRAWASLDKPIIAMIRGLLHRRRPAHRAAGRHPHRRRGQPVRRPGRPPRPRVRLRRRRRADRAGRAGVTAEILFSARRLDAAEALRIGLVNRVVPAADLEAEVMEPGRDDHGQRPAHRRRLQGGHPQAAAAARRPRDLAAGDGDGRGVLPVRGLPGGAAGVRREAAAPVLREMTVTEK